MCKEEICLYISKRVSCNIELFGKIAILPLGPLGEEDVSPRFELFPVEPYLDVLGFYNQVG